MTWEPPPGVPDEQLARMAFASAQAALASGAAESRAIVSCGWHGTDLHPDTGSFAVVKSTGPLQEAVGERVRVTQETGGPSVTAYVVSEEDILEDISLTRSLFARLALLSTDELRVVVEVLG